MKELNLIRCRDCDLQYEVTWNYDGMNAPDQFCPRCASEDLELPEKDVEDRVMGFISSPHKPKIEGLR